MVNRIFLLSALVVLSALALLSAIIQPLQNQNPTNLTKLSPPSNASPIAELTIQKHKISSPNVGESPGLASSTLQQERDNTTHLPIPDSTVNDDLDDPDLSPTLQKFISKTKRDTSQMTTMELQQYTKEVIDELSIYVESGEVHPYEASLLHLHLMKDKLQKQDSELLALADNVALHYKQLSPQR